MDVQLCRHHASVHQHCVDRKKPLAVKRRNNTGPRTLPCDTANLTSVFDLDSAKVTVSSILEY